MASVTTLNACVIPEKSNDLYQLNFINSELDTVERITSKILTIGFFTNSKIRVNDNMMINEKNIVVLLLNLKLSKEENKRIHR